MSTSIKCTNCGHEFPLESALADEMREGIEREKALLRQQMQDYKLQKEEETKRLEESYRQQKKQQEEVFREQMEQSLKAQQQASEEKIRKQLHQDFELQLKAAQDDLVEQEAKLKAARERELEFLQKERALKAREEELELQLQRQLIDEREKLKKELVKEQQGKLEVKEQEFLMRQKELEKQIEDQKKLVDEMKRKAEQGSMQLQGEVQELLLEDLLRNTFPYDTVEEVGKGVMGADCIQTVRSRFGNEAGKIIFESKRTKDFSNEWIEKLKADMRHLGADLAVIVTQALPKDFDRFGEKDGVYICTFLEVRNVVQLLRNSLLKIAEVKTSGENKGDKMVMLYDYLTSHEFGDQWKAIQEGFQAMRISIQKERDAMERLWKAREKQLEKVLLNASHIRGSISGIAGADTINLNLLDDGEQDLLA